VHFRQSGGLLIELVRVEQMWSTVLRWTVLGLRVMRCVAPGVAAGSGYALVRGLLRPYWGSEGRVRASTALNPALTCGFSVVCDL
jgi:hypothetical protein